MGKISSSNIMDLTGTAKLINAQNNFTNQSIDSQEDFKFGLNGVTFSNQSKIVSEQLELHKQSSSLQ